MFTVTINGNTLEELLANLAAMLNAHKPGAPATAHQPEPIPAQPIVPTATLPSAEIPQAPTTPQVNNVVSMAPPAAQGVPVATAQPAAAPAAPFTPTQGVPVAAAPTYTLDALARAGATLAQSGKMDQALALLAKYSVQTVNQLQPEQYGAFATELRALGAQL